MENPNKLIWCIIISLLVIHFGGRRLLNEFERKTEWLARNGFYRWRIQTDNGKTRAVWINRVSKKKIEERRLLFMRWKVLKQEAEEET